ncbi:MAG: hypothetical protein HZB41_12960 [Ignavibacteriae bacterium]|nr:hypothetical protein [Ignavibacteriota bacterium]
MKQINKQIADELKGLQEKIRYNFASLEDYKKYEQMLLDYGYSQDEIQNELKRMGFYSWEQYINNKSKPKTFAERLKDGEFNGWILGLGTALLLYFALKDDKK